MNQLFIELPPTLLRNAIALSLSALVVSLALRMLKVSSPRIRRAAYLGVVIQGCLLMRMAVEIPLLEPAEPDGQRFEVLNDPQLSSDIARIAVADELPLIDANPGVQPSANEPAARIESPAPRARWAMWLTVGWSAGIVLLVCYSAWSYCIWLRNMPLEREPTPEWASEWYDLQREAGVRSPVPLYVTQHLGPMLCRLPGGYRLIVPDAYWSELQAVQRAAILRHELAHLLRGDVWKSMAIRILALPQWFNPLAWWAVRRYDDCAEWACDEAAKIAEPDHVAEYARALLQLGDRSKALMLTSPAASGTGLSQRIRRLLSTNSGEDSKMKKLAMVTLILGVSLFNVLKVDLSAQEAATPIVAAGSDEAPAVAPTLAVSVEKPEPQANTVNAAGRTVRKATVDLGQLIRNDETYRRDSETLKAEIERAEESTKRLAQELEETKKRLKELGKDNANNAQREDLADQLVVQQADFKAQRVVQKRRALRRETEIGQRLFGRIRAEVAAYAKEHGIQAVWPAPVSSKRGDTANVDSHPDGDRLDPTAVTRAATRKDGVSGNISVTTGDVGSPSEIYKRMNQEGIYSEETVVLPATDITEEILKRLNAKESGPKKDDVKR